MDYSPPGSSVLGISQARIRELFAISFCRGSSQPRDRAHIFCLVGGLFTAELLEKEILGIHTWNVTLTATKMTLGNIYWWLDGITHLMDVSLSELQELVMDCREQELRLWQRSWGRRLGICKGGIEPQEFPWKFSSIYPLNQGLPTFCFVLSPTPLTLWGAVPHYLSLKKELTYSSS